MKKIISAVFLLISASCVAQKIPDFGFNKIRVVQGDKIIQADLKPVNSIPIPSQDLWYYWYRSNDIHVTQGDFSGRLLNGVYTEYYLNKNLKVQGSFNKGLKNGIWKNWNEDGNLTDVYTWSYGKKSGEFTLYDGHGKLKQVGNYKNDLLEGKVRTYLNTNVTMVKYHQGQMIPENHNSFFERINIFKKKKVDIKPVKTNLN
jgi:hypothetical protein